MVVQKNSPPSAAFYTIFNYFLCFRNVLEWFNSPQARFFSIRIQIEAIFHCENSIFNCEKPKISLAAHYFFDIYGGPQNKIFEIFKNDIYGSRYISIELFIFLTTIKKLVQIDDFGARVRRAQVPLGACVSLGKIFHRWSRTSAVQHGSSALWCGKNKCHKKHVFAKLPKIGVWTRKILVNIKLVEKPTMLIHCLQSSANGL